MDTLAGHAVFLDRDGTLIDDVGYPWDPRQVRLLDGSAAALALLRQRGYRLVVASNQSGIGRGLVTRPQAEQVHQQVVRCFAEAGVCFDAALYCPHTPEDHCACRKPAPGMLQRAAADLQLDLARCFMVGDKSSDIEAGRRAGCRTILLAGKQTPANGEPRPDHLATHWRQVVDHILSPTGRST